MVLVLFQCFRKMLILLAPRVASEEPPKSLSPQELRDAGDRATPSVTRQNVRCDDRS